MNGTLHLELIDYISMVSNGIFALAALYLVAALLYFEIWKCKEHKPCNESCKTPRFLRILCIVCSLLALFHHMVVLSSYFSGNAPSTCYIFGVLWLVTYALALLGTYIFLWTRQHTINASKRLKYLRRKTILFLSWSALVVLILGTVMVFLAGSRLIFFSNCTENQDHALLKVYTIILSGILLSLTVIGQTQLLALFVIPLVKHHFSLNAKLQESTRSRSFSTVVKSDSGSNFIVLVKRCVLVAIVCVITDVFASVTTITVQHPAAKLIYDLNLLVNVGGCVFIFPNWKQMLLPCNLRTPKTTQSSADSCLHTDDASHDHENHCRLSHLKDSKYNTESNSIANII